MANENNSEFDSLEHSMNSPSELIILKLTIDSIIALSEVIPFKMVQIHHSYHEH
jgi:hypothetical protein